VTGRSGQDEPLAVPPEAGPGTADPTGVPELIALIDRLEPMLEASGLAEIEIASGDTTVVLRAPVVGIGSVPAAPAAPAPAHAAGHRDKAGAVPAEAGEEDDGLRQVTAPLTGVFYLSPSPGAAPYIRVGGEVLAGQVIGLLEAMKLFNEIKSDVTGVVRRIVAESGALVKTHQVLIEVEPT
jgi:acetyl-CoA carboxylase biotin carboxyl carrier protein